MDTWVIIVIVVVVCVAFVSIFVLIWRRREKKPNISEPTVRSIGPFEQEGVYYPAGEKPIITYVDKRTITQKQKKLIEKYMKSNEYLAEKSAQNYNENTVDIIFRDREKI